MAEFRTHLEAQPFPQYHPVPGRLGYLLRIEADGTRTLGLVVNGRFEPDGKDEGDRK